MNQAIFSFFYSFSHQSVFFDNLIIFLSVYFPYIVLIIAGLFVLMHHEILRAENPYQVFLQKKKEVLMVFFTSGAAWIIAKLLKIFIHASRPFMEIAGVQVLFPETGFAFPSGHATAFMALAFSIFFLHKKAGYVFIVFAFVIGIARIVAGVHFPVDILGGFILGVLIAYFAKKI